MSDKWHSWCARRIAELRLGNFFQLVMADILEAWLEMEVQWP